MKAKKLAEELLDGEKLTLRSMIGDGGALLDRLFEIRHIDEVSHLVKKAVEPRDKSCADDDVRDINSRNKPRGENGEAAHRRSSTGKSQSKENPGRKVSFKIRGGSSPYKATSAASFRRGRTLLSDGKMGGVRSNNVAKLASKFNSLVLEGGDKERADHPPSAPKCEEPPPPKKKLVDSEVTVRHADTKERPKRSVSRHSSLLKIQHIGNVKATIRIFEESAKHSHVAGSKPVVDVAPCKKAVTVQEHPKYCKVVFKNSGKLVMVDCGDIDGPKYSAAPTGVSGSEPSTNNKPPYYETNAKCAQLDTLETPNENDVCVAMTAPSITRDKMSPGARTLGDQGAHPDPAFENVQTSRDVTNNVCSGQREAVDFLQKAPIPARLDVLGEKEDEDVSTYAVKPNSSFLWGRPSEDVVAAPDQTYQAVRVLIVGRDDANDYDDVCAPSDDATYDDVGVYCKEERHEGVCDPASAQDKHSYEYCDPALSYDDCEGEGYEFVGDGQEPSDEANIYDDVKCVSDSQVVSDDVTSISNCYESIYSLGTGDDRRVLKMTPPSSLAGSFCDKSNSLYGAAESRFDSASVSQASTLSADYAPRSMSLERPGPGSEASDEWMDVDASHSEGETEAVKAAQERFRARRSPKWSRKVRRQRCKSVRRSAAGPTDCGGETSTESEPDHHYEMLYEVVGGQNNHKHIIEEDDFDSFDSDDSAGTYRKPGTRESFDVNTRLPDLPSGQNIYGITKIAEAAGKKMLKFRKSLSRMRTKRNSTDLGILTVVRTPSPPPVPAAPPPLRTAPPPPPVLSPALSTPPPLPSAPPPVRSTAHLPPTAPMEKAASSTSLARRKYWSLRRFKRSLSSVSQYPSALPHQGAKETATFYLTPAVDADISPSSQERRTSAACSESSDVPSSQSSCGSTNTLVYESRLDDRIMAKKRPPVERPHSPPPLPPTAPSEVPKRVPRRREKKTGNSSWYAECGLFDQAELANHNHTDVQRRGSAKSDKPNSYSLYAEVGLWDATAYSLDTSQSSCGSDNTYGYDKSHRETRFADEPLYQFYTAAVAEQVQRNTRDDTDSDGYEEICDVNSQISAAPRPTAMELILPREGKQRTLWCEIPEVLNSQVLGTINSHQRKLQEAKFEIITSEASYANSLNVLEKNFISSRELHDESILSKNDRRTLFSNVLPVRNCSAKFLSDLEACWQDSIMLQGICNIIYEHATSHFGVYVKYCSNQIYLDRTLRRLKEQHGKFAEALSELEASPVCQSLSLHSFLMLPMQRITRLPLLMDAVLTRLDPEDEEYSTCKLALATLNKIVQECNEGARRMERMEEILILNRQLEFSREVKAVPIISSSRWLIKKGELTHIIWRGDEGKLTFGKKFSKVTVHLFLFTDMLIITKKKSEDSYLVIDYCPRNLIHIAVAADEVPHLPVKFTSDNSKHLMLLTMLQNHEKKTVEMVLSCPLESDRQRWLEAVNPPVSVNPGETVYSEWDCPQVTAIHSYVANQPDELSLNVTDVVNVLRKMPDGWYQGERIRDRETGWFPGNYTVEVVSAHVRARNLKQRYRLLALSGNYLIMQAKEKSSK